MFTHLTHVGPFKERTFSCLPDRTLEFGSQVLVPGARKNPPLEQGSRRSYKSYKTQPTYGVHADANDNDDDDNPDNDDSPDDSGGDGDGDYNDDYYSFRTFFLFSRGLKWLNTIR